MTPLLWFLLGIASALIAVSPILFVLGTRPERRVLVREPELFDTATPANLASAEVRQ